MKKIDFKTIDMTAYHKVLKNGLNVYLIPYKYKSNFYISFASKFGSIMRDFAPAGSDDIKQYPLGIAHFLEHKMFENENGIDPFTFFNQFGTDANANTNYKVTQYICYGNNDVEKNLEYLLDYVSKPYFTDENVEKEKGIIAQEIEMYDDEADWVIDEELRKALFKKHPIRDDIAGTVEEINKITKEDLYECYNTFYNPSNMALFVSGKFNLKSVDKILSKYENKISKEKNEIKLKDYEETIEVNEKLVKIKGNIVTPKLAYGVKIPISDINLDDIVKINMYINMFLNLKFGTTSLFRENTRKSNLMTNLYMESDMVDKFLTISFFVETDKQKEFLEELKNEINKNDVEEKDIERLKKVWISSEVQMSDNIEVTVDNLLYDIIKFGNIISNKVDIIKSLNKDEFNKVIESINFDNASCVFMNPKK